MIMIKKLGYSIIFMIPLLSVAQGPTFCSSPTMTPGGANSCISTCAAMAERAVVNAGLAVNQYGFCEGVATARFINIYKIELGRLAINDNNRCTIWEGDMRINIGGSPTGSAVTSSKPINVKSCAKGLDYDAYFLTIGRYEYITGEAVFPDGSGKKVQTTSTYAGVDAKTNQDFLDSGFTDPSKFYTRPPGWTTGAFKKIGTVPSSADLASANPVEITWDEIKSSYGWATDSTSRPGFRCFPQASDDCVGEIPGSPDRYVTIMPNASPIKLNDDDETIQLAWIRFASKRGGTDSVGIRFVWVNDGGVLKYAAVTPSSDQGYFELRQRGKSSR